MGELIHNIEESEKRHGHQASLLRCAILKNVS
ncbi:hypothetical protein MNBD_ALPHA04-503 [hydrothermal vent metagenome]|uniref:Uncharacterized protein n=1 Tax=hydrothermal vent metagenome TaxID=652676 RepID=A0A3B0RET7_9ZZZZ